MESHSYPYSKHFVPPPFDGLLRAEFTRKEKRSCLLFIISFALHANDIIGMNKCGEFIHISFVNKFICLVCLLFPFFFSLALTRERGKDKTNKRFQEANKRTERHECIKVKALKVESKKEKLEMATSVTSGSLKC